MSEKKKTKPNPIEDAIGKRAKDPTAAEKFKAEFETEPLPPMEKMKQPSKPPTLEELKKQTIEKQIPIDDSLPGEIPDKTTETEMQSLEELNRQTENRLLENNDDPMLSVGQAKIPVSKPDLPPVIQNCSQESQPPQEKKKIDPKPRLADLKPDFKPTDLVKDFSAEEPDLTTLKAYILDNGFTVAAVAMHVVMLCSQPQVTPATTDWHYRDRALIPDMISATLKSEGYIEECLWPSLKIIMGSNIGNTAWTAEIAITLAFFDCILNLPDMIEL